MNGTTATVQIEAGTAQLVGDLGIPDDARGVVLFAHGSGSSRHSRRNQYVAQRLRDAGFGTLLLDLLTMAEAAVDERTQIHRFDIRLLAQRLVGAVDWLAANPSTAGYDIGCFGASTGGAAALVAAAERPGQVAAVVSRGGRPDLAGEALARVRVPTLLIVGELDTVVLELNREAMQRMTGAEVVLQIVPGATHLFEEPGKLDVVTDLTSEWFARHLGAGVRGRS